MKPLLHIQLIALSLLLIFSASVFAVCMCDHENNKTVARHACCCKKTSVVAAKKDSKEQCPCGKKIIKFNKAEKQIAQATASGANPPGNVVLPLTAPYNATINPASAVLCIKEKMFRLCQPPDYYIMYQSLRI